MQRLLPKSWQCFLCATECSTNANVTPTVTFPTSTPTATTTVVPVTGRHPIEPKVRLNAIYLSESSFFKSKLTRFLFKFIL